MTGILRDKAPLTREGTIDYRRQQSDGLTRINRIVAPLAWLFVAYVTFFSDRVSFPEYANAMFLGRIYGLVGAGIATIGAFIPGARRLGILLSAIMVLAGQLMSAHLTAVMNNNASSLQLWLILTIVMCGIYPLPLEYSFIAVMAGLAYYVVAYISSGFPLNVDFQQVIINMSTASFVTLAMKIGMERLRRREYVFRKGLEKANSEIASLNDQLKDENLRLSHEVAIAQHIQSIVLPQEKDYRAFRDLQISCRMIPATEVGGDFYDTICFGPDGYISIGDVTDHGLHSGLIMMMVHTALRALSHVERNDIQRVFKVINRLLFDFRVKTEDHRIMSLAILKYMGDGNFVMTGQHESLLILRADGTVQDIDSLEYGMYAGLDENVGPYLGLLRFSLKTDDVLVLYTDGVTEALNKDGRQFTVHGIVEAALPVRGSPAPDIEKAIVDACQAHLGETRRFDDISVMVVKKMEDPGWDGAMHGTVRLGDTIDMDQGAETSFTINFLPLDMFDNWNRGGMLSDFTADYFRHNFPAEEQFGLLSTVVNELVENAVKFTANNSLPVGLTLRKAGDRVLIQATNSVSQNRCGPFMDVCRELFKRNLDELYVERMEKGKVDKEASGLGLLLIKKDYGAKLGFQFRFDDENAVHVAVMAELELG